MNNLLVIKSGVNLEAIHQIHILFLFVENMVTPDLPNAEKPHVKNLPFRESTNNALKYIPCRPPEPGR